MTYVPPTPRSYGHAVSAAGDWNVIVNAMRNFQERLLVLEGSAPPPTPSPTNIPIGGIIIWSGAVVNIPASFALCNGANGTPDLRDRFIPGAGGAYAPNDAGGFAAHTHTVGATGSSGGHSHTVSGTTGGPSATSSHVSGSTSVASSGHTHAFSAGSSSAGGHTHSNPATGSTSNLPPYYALCYIMRIS